MSEPIARNVFVTGAAGFVGLALCRALRAQEPPPAVYGLCRSADQADRLRAAGVEPVIGDLTNVGAFAEQLAEAEFVFHMGGDATFGEGAHYQAVNVDATRAIVTCLERARATHPDRLKRLVFASSIGAVDRAPTDACATPLHDQSPAFPSSAYGRSKLDAEQIIAGSSLPFTSLRFPWVYGPGMRPGSHIAVMMSDAARGKFYTRIPFYGRVSVLYIDDLVDIMIRLMTSPAAMRACCLVDDGTPRSFNEIFAAGRREGGRRASVLPVPRLLQRLPLVARRRLPFTLRVVLEDALVCRSSLPATLGKASFMPFERGLAATWAYVSGLSTGVHVVTGAASGIGRALATRLVADGQRVVLIDVSPTVADVATELGQPFFQLDLSDLAAVQVAAGDLTNRWGFVEGLINCAGLGIRADFDAHTSDQIQRTIAVNFTAAALLCHAVLPEMRRRRKGYIINVASSISHVPVPYMSLYAASKAALASLGQSLAAELAGGPVQVLTAFPSGTHTDFQRAAGVKVLRDGRGLLHPDLVAKQIMAARARGRSVVWIGGAGRVLDLATRFMPAAVQRVFWRAAMKAAR